MGSSGTRARRRCCRRSRSPTADGDRFRLPQPLPNLPGDRFRREAESASGIGNEHIIDVHDFGELEDGSTYFVMECLEGLDLIDAIDVARRMPEGRAIHIATQLCRALGAAHDAGIVHRDLKPENVFLIRRNDTEDFVKVLDFGIAKVANGPKRLTRDGEVLGATMRWEDGTVATARRSVSLD